MAAATDLSKHATITATHEEFVQGQVPIETSPFELLSKLLTIEEKVQLLSGTNFTSTAGVDRLNIPALKVCINTIKVKLIIFADNSVLTGS